MKLYVVAGVSCPANWKYPFKCPQELNVNSNKTGTCCYDNGPNCCEAGGRRCSDSGSSERDYCPRPKDDKKLKYCCTKKGQPSCCESSGVPHKARWDNYYYTDLVFFVILCISLVCSPYYSRLTIVTLWLWGQKSTMVHLRTFARKSSSIDSFLRFSPVRVYEKLGGHRILFEDNMSGRSP